MKNLVTILLLFLVGNTISAQVSVGYTADKDTISVGELLTLSLKINGNPSEIESIDFSPLFKNENLYYQYDTTKLEEFLDVSIINADALGINNQKQKLAGNEVKVISGDIKIGIYSFGGGPLNNPIVKLKDGSQPIYLQRPMIMVLPPDNFQAMLDSLNLENIKPIIREGTHWTDFLKYLYLLLGLIGLFVLGKYLYAYKKDETEIEFEEEVISIPAHITAMKELAELKEKQLWQSGKVKEYQSELTRIMRAYITDRYDMPALEMTTTELKKQLLKMKLSTEQISKMSDILQIADKVKFAKGTAGPEINERFMGYAKEWVQETKTEETITE